MPFVPTHTQRNPTAQYRRAVVKQMGRRALGMGQDSSVDINFGPADSSSIDSGLPAPMPPDTFPSLPSTPAAAAGPSTNWFQNLLQGATAGLKLYQTAQGPSLVPGTNAIYNPATGQYYNPTTGQVVNPAGATIATAVTSSPVLLIGGVVVAGLVLFALVKK